MVIYSKTYAFDESIIITLAEAKAHLVIEHSLDDTMIETIIKAAYQSVEQYLNRILLKSTITYQVNSTTDSFIVKLPEPQVYKTVGALVAIGEDSTEVAVNSKTVKLTNGCLEFSDIVLATPKDVTAYRVAIDYEPKLLNYSINAAVYLMITHLYENRNAVVVGTSSGELPLGVKSILAANKYYTV